jgi:RHH-type rel operon transcriptional repressor/antitoxin RelB
MLAVRLSKELEGKLTHLADSTHRSKSYYVKMALENFLREQGDYLEAVAAYEDYLQSGEKGYTLEEMKQRYGIE